MWLKNCLLFVVMFTFVFGAACDPRDHIEFAGGGNPNGDGTYVTVNVFTALDGDGDKYIRGSFENGCRQLQNAADQAQCFEDIKDYATSGNGLRANDCDDHDPTVYPGAPELCDGKDNDCNGQADDGLMGCCHGHFECPDDSVCTSTTAGMCSALDCDDNDACTADSAEMHACVNNPVSDCCNENVDCSSSGLCTSQTATVAGECVECLVHSDCDDGLFCNGAETCATDNTCQAGADPCLNGEICDEAQDMCAQCFENADCPTGLCLSNVCVGCLTDNDCAGGLLCDSGSNTCVECLADEQCDDGAFCNGAETCATDNTCQAGANPCLNGEICDEAQDMCAQCLGDSDCADNEFCDASSNLCEPVVCLDDNDECTSEVATSHTCVHQSLALCCHGPSFDSECASSCPTLPPGYIWGCSTGTVAPSGTHMCTSCLDEDHDGYCATEFCGNGLDDDADGYVDESDCINEVCDLYGAHIKNITSNPLDVVYHTYALNWQLVAPTNPLPFPYQNFEVETMTPNTLYGGNCILGIDVVPSGLFDRATWLGKTNAQQQAVCEQKFICYNAQGLEAIPVINPADPEHSCFCPYNATPAVP